MPDLEAIRPRGTATARLRPLAIVSLPSRRRLFQAGFFLLFLIAPAMDWLRFDLTRTQLYFLGLPWHLGIDDLVAGRIGPTEAALQLLGRAFLPALVLIAAFLAVAWRHGRLYCGWLCPHFSLVETLNTVLHRACGKLSLWDRERVPRAGADGRLAQAPDRRWWPLFALACLIAGFTWAVTLLSYLLPPARVWSNLLAGSPTPGEARFLIAGTLVFTAEFAFARHLFCRFGCAVGLFQSLVWMANPRGRVVGYARERAMDCRTCRSGLPAAECGPAGADVPGDACEHACPMRLRPRREKRWMFSCVQCGECVAACARSQRPQGHVPLLEVRVGEAALRETLRLRREAAATRTTPATGEPPRGST